MLTNLLKNWQEDVVNYKKVNWKKGTINFCLVGIVCVSLTGCSVYMAANQPSPKDLSVIKKGTERGLVISELGVPKVGEERNGKKVEIYMFKQGYHGMAKAGRAVFHGAADVFTLGLWEIVGTPGEAYFDGTDMTIEVTYDENNKVESSRILKGVD